MSLLARFSLGALALALFMLVGCSSSHMPTTDGGPMADAACIGSPSTICVVSCGTDFGSPPECVGGAWVCPAGTTDIHECHSSCPGTQPARTCHCEGTSWVCPDETCPAGLNPWDPDEVCEPEGRHCQSGSTTDQCSSFLSCDCEGGHWNCLFAEPDPACWCGRQPDVGSVCRDEGTSCGECCPTAGGTGWPAMTCVDGHWQHAACPEIVCPPIEAGTCPVDRAAALGTSCAAEGTLCGNACCGRGFMCSGGVWVEGPDVDCITCDETATYECGEGTCERGQACTSGCGPDDGIVHTCTRLDSGCNSCSCTPVPPGSTCEERDGFVFVRQAGFCG